MLTPNPPRQVTQGNWTRDTLSAAIKTHIANVVGHYAGSCYSWDVVNEALNDGNGTFRSSVFFRTLGTDFIPLSFQAAAAADPAAKLYYNDFSLEFGGSKTDSALDIVRLVQNSTAAFPGARIDGVGFQGHMTVGGTPTASQLAAIFARFTALNVEVAVTELDIRVTKLPSTDVDRQQQARDYVSVMGACLSTPRCVGVVVWQFSDKYSWVPSTFQGAGEACLYDQNFSRKPAWTSLSSQLAAAAATAPAGAASGSVVATATATRSGVGGARTRAAGPSGPGVAAAVPTGSTTSGAATVQVAGSGRVVVGVEAVSLTVLCGVFMLLMLV